MPAVLRSFPVVILCLLPGVALAQKKAEPDHGVVLAAAMEVAPGRLKDTTNLADTKNYVFRGRVISLGKHRTVSLCFDTEQMRVAGAWVGKPVRWSADKNMGPAVDGTMIFSTRPGPGWDHGGKWDDPREGKEGPLPRAWAHYKGLYLNGDKVVLSYTVGECSVLEMPGVIEKGGLTVVTRTFNISPTTKPHTLLVAEEVESITRTPGSPKVAKLRMGGQQTVGILHSAPEGAKFEHHKSRLHLTLPVLPKGAAFKLFVAPVHDGGELGQFIRLCEGPTEEIVPLTKGGPPRWKDVIETKGTVAADTAPYVVDRIGLPEDNPWRASVRFGGLDFFKDGRAALCTWDGDVWIVSGLDGKLDKVRWKRFASGLQQPLGLKIINGVIHTAGRDQITRLHDLNGDGEADFYENLNNDAGLTLQRHEFVMDLETDAQGNLWFCRSGHYIKSKRGDNCAVYKLSPDGTKLEKMASGFREPNGLSIAADGTMTVADNEGNGIPQTPLYRLKPGGFYGYTPGEIGGEVGKGGSWKYTEKPFLWLPKEVDRSAGGQVWVTSEKFGPLKGQLLHTSYGHCALYEILLDKAAEPWQGAAWKLPLAFSSGVMRARFHPLDGQLYLCGLRGWSTNAVKDGEFCRVRWTGTKLPVPVGFRVTKAGLEVSFSGPLDAKSAADEDSWAGEWSDPIGKGAVKKKEELPITAAKLSTDGKTVTVELARVVPVSNFVLQYRLKAADGAAVTGELHGTIHRVP